MHYLCNKRNLSSRHRYLWRDWAYEILESPASHYRRNHKWVRLLSHQHFADRCIWVKRPVNCQVKLRWWRSGETVSLDEKYLSQLMKKRKTLQLRNEDKDLLWRKSVKYCAAFKASHDWRYIFSRMSDSLRFLERPAGADALHTLARPPCPIRSTMKKKK